MLARCRNLFWVRRLFRIFLVAFDFFKFNFVLVVLLTILLLLWTLLLLFVVGMFPTMLILMTCLTFLALLWLLLLMSFLVVVDLIAFRISLVVDLFVHHFKLFMQVRLCVTRLCFIDVLDVLLRIPFILLCFWSLVIVNQLQIICLVHCGLVLKVLLFKVLDELARVQLRMQLSLHFRRELGKLIVLTLNLVCVILLLWKLSLQQLLLLNEPLSFVLKLFLVMLAALNVVSDWDMVAFIFTLEMLLVEFSHNSLLVLEQSHLV